MNQWHDSVEINPAGKLRPKSDQSNSVTASPLKQALLDLDEEHAFEMRRLFERVRTGAHVWNAQFDRILPIRLRRFSISHWTPVHVARRAAQLLVTGPETRVLDVGSGPGKFCLVGALATLGHFTGVEQRPHLVELSRSFAHKYAIPRVHFLCANAADLDWSQYNGFYFYNPFYENLDTDKKLDERVELSPSLYDRYIKMTQDRLAQARSGTRVVTFHGMGGEMPGGYERVVQEFRDIGFLELWIKNPSPEELISLQRNSRRPEDLQAPCLSALDRAGGETPLWVSVCASALDAAHVSED
ncbi:MAG TPA: class I SAM-dependent methyltransferase [Terriglobia bacterium]|nr:class I SAM-dependent methyltransferase [Terriglobia bacterium]